MEITFCNNSEIKEAIVALINKEITPGLQETVIENFYKDWKEKFETDTVDFKFSNKVIATDFFLPDIKSLVGVDYPTWFNINSSNTKRIMILGIDPLRNKNAFNSEGAGINTEAIIGTPYALHRKSMREGKDGKDKSYWEFIKSMLNKNYGIYLTDIFKIYFMIENKRSYDHKIFIKNEQKHLKQILDKEIEIIKPDLIIVLGNKPLGFLCEQKIKLTDKISTNLEYNNTPILPMVHLSGLASGGRKTFINNNLSVNDSKNDVNSYLNIVDNFISGSN
ncbi:uracil-DNA glycosylase family protein [Mucilaginibacter sp.]|uniref:uracil-DNA glycosylase family protein n=1 Tax=Mucilaginibacter sp. TaxID=1882438 RepID=UPI003AFFFF7D